MENSWAVIKFPDEEDAVAAVPTSWLHGNQCYWPPWSQDRINSAIKNCKPPDVEAWQTHPFIPMRNNVFDDFESAKKKMKRAAETSDLDSQLESQSQQTDTNLKKRKTVKTMFTRFASYEVSEDESIETCTLPEPPKFKGVMKKKKSEASAMISDNNTDNGDDRHHNENQDTIVNPAVIQVASVSAGHVSPDLQHITEYLKKIIRKQNIMQSTLADLAEDINEIKNKIGQNNPSSGEDAESIFAAVNLPIDSETDLEKLEEYLSEDTMMSTAVKETASSGGKNVYDLIYRATQKLITNKFASNYSYYGRQKKFKFSTLKLNELLKKAALKIFPNCSEKAAEVAIAKWLRRCTERARKENKDTV